MIYLYGIFSLSLIFFGIFNFIKNTTQRVYSFILIFLGLQFCFEFIEIVQRTIFSDPNSIAMSFSIVEMSLDKINSYHLIILITGTLSLIIGNIFFKNYFISKGINSHEIKTTNKIDYISNNFFYYLFLFPIFFICLFLLYQFVATMGGLSNIFQNIGMYRSGEFSNTGSGYLLYPSLIVFPAITVYFLIHNKHYPSNQYKALYFLSLFGMFALLLIGTIVSGFRIHLLIWTFVLFATGLIGSNINIKVVLVAGFIGTTAIFLGVSRAFIEGGISIDAINLFEIFIVQLNRVPSLSLISLTEVNFIPRFEHLVQFIFEPITLWFFPSIWFHSIGESYAYDVAYEFLYLRSGYVTNLGGISINPILFFYWMLGAIFMPLMLFIFGILTGLCDKLLNTQSKSKQLYATYISIFLILSIETPPGALSYLIFVGITWVIIICIETLIINAIKKLQLLKINKTK